MNTELYKTPATAIIDMKIRNYPYLIHKRQEEAATTYNNRIITTITNETK